MGENFLRTYEISFKGKTSTLSFGNKIASDMPLRINFDIEKGDSESTNNAKVQIYGLNKTHIKFLEGKKVKCTLKAGYNMNNVLILHGTVKSATTDQDAADRYTEIEVADGSDELSNTKLNISVKNAKTSKGVYQAIAKKMGVSIQFGKGLKFKSLKKGWHFVGTAKAGLQKLTKYNGHKFSIQNGVLQIVKTGQPLKSKVFIINERTGLINRPKKITIESNKKKQNGWEITYFLNGAINVNDVVRLECEEANGNYRVKNVKITGDNYSGDWQCVAQVVRYK